MERPHNLETSSQERVPVLSLFIQYKHKWKLLEFWSASKMWGKVEVARTGKRRVSTQGRISNTQRILLPCLVTSFCVAPKSLQNSPVIYLPVFKASVGWGKGIHLKFHVIHTRIICYSMKILFTRKSIRGRVSLAEGSLPVKNRGIWRNLNVGQAFPAALSSCSLGALWHCGSLSYRLVWTRQTSLLCINPLVSSVPCIFTGSTEINCIYLNCDWLFLLCFFFFSFSL